MSKGGFLGTALAVKRIVVLRPEPGNTATCARIAAAGGTAVALPLFVLKALAWESPPPENFDALIITSANAIRHGGPELASYRSLPVFAVGAASAAAARDAGFTVAAVGNGDALALVREHPMQRALHLAGRDRARAQLSGVSQTIAVYASELVDVAAADLSALAGSVALVHSPRAGTRLAALVPDRSTIRIAAISEAALAAAGPGWAATTVAARPDDPALITAALALAD